VTAQAAISARGKAAAALDHSNICMVLKIDKVDGRALLSMQPVEGPTVKEKVRERGTCWFGATQRVHPIDRSESADAIGYDNRTR